MGKKNFYAVAAGRRPGLYRSWEQCREQVEGFRGNRYKGFGSPEEALQYLLSHGVDVAHAEPTRHAQPATAGKASGAATAAAADRAAAAAAAAAGEAATAAAGGPPAAGGGAQGGAPASAPGAQRRRPPTAAPKPKRKRAPQHAAVAAHSSDAAEAGEPQRVPAPAAPAASEQLPAATVLRLEFDGACKRNPGPSGFGAVLYDEATGAEVARVCRYMGDRHTNNQAEYAGLIAGLQAALELGCRAIRVQGDSTLIIKQVLGQWQVKHEGLRPYAATAVALRSRFADFRAQQVPREYNTAADALSNQAIEQYRSGVDTRVWRLEDVQRALGQLGGEERAEPAKRARLQ